MMKKLIAIVAASTAVGVYYAQAEEVSPAGSAQQYSGAPLSSQDVVTVSAREVGARATLGGSVVPERSVTLTAQMPGRVVYLIGAEGARFPKGAVLVALGDDELLSQRTAAVADANNAMYALRNAQVQYDRELYSGSSSPNTGMGMGLPNMFDQFFTRPMGDMAGLGNPGVERRAEVYGAVASVEQAQAQLHRSRAAIQGIDSKLRDTRSVAPFEGVITQKFAEVGDTVQPGQPLVKIANDKRLQVRVDVPARLMNGSDIKTGDVVPIKLDISDKIIDATVAVVFPVADPQRHTVTVKLDLPADSGGRPGMYVEVQMPDTSVPNSAMPWVPRSAVLWRGSLPAVFVVGADNRKELRMVRVGTSDGDGYTVLSGLSVGERIFKTPLPGMVSGWNAATGR